MKIRTSFVANSSSSSFIIQCEKIPTTHKESREVWFGKNQKYIPEIVSEFLFDSLKPIDLSLEKIKELGNALSYFQIVENVDESNEISFLIEVANSFWFDETYGDLDEKSNLNKWLLEKNFVENKYSIPYDLVKEYEKEYFDLPEIKAKFVKLVDHYLFKLEYPKKDTKVFMIGEIEDYTELGAEVEHNDYFWEKMPGYVSFNHH